MPTVVAVSVGVTAAAFFLAGVALSMSGRARVPGTLLVLASAAVVLYLGGALTSNAAAEDLGFTVAWTLYTLALVTFPRFRMEDPVDLLVATAVVGLPVVLVVVGHPFRPATNDDESTAFLFILACLLVVRTYWRLERGRGDERRATVWLAFAAGTAWVGGGLIVFGSESVIGAVVAALLQAVVPVCLWIGVSRPDWVDARGLASLVAVTLTTALAYVAAFMTAVSLLELLGVPTPPYVLAVLGALTAAGFHPLRQRLRSAVDEMLFGLRPDPLKAAGQVADHFSNDPVTALDAIRATLALPFVALQDARGREVMSGQPVPHTREIRLPGSGVLVVGLRPGDLTLPAGDERVLRLVAPLLAQTLHAQALADDLQESREQTITAIEEERRRLRRDLHDGLGPRLAGIAFTADAVRNHLGPDQGAAEDLVQGLRSEAGTAIREIRELVYAMRPPALDELGLLAAVLQASSLLRTPSGEPLVVEVEAPDLPALPAAVEVAAYRIIVEAVRNVSRHSDSPEAQVRLALADRTLEVTVSDRGSSTGPWQAGVGLSSMRERAEELGGSLEVTSGPGGSQVRAVLPLPGR